MKRRLLILPVGCAVFLSMVLMASAAEPLVYEGTDGIGKGKHIVFIANDHEYRSEQSCPLVAKILAKHHGFRCTVLFGEDKDGFILPGGRSVPGMEALKDADLLFFFTRFMNLPDEQVDLLVEYFERGGPVVGARTSTHCFNGQKGKWKKLNFNYSGDEYSGGLGKQVFGNTWESRLGQSHYGHNHHMGGTVSPIDDASDHPVLRGVHPMHTYSGAYRSQPPSDATPLLSVQVIKSLGPGGEAHPDKPPVNAGWTREQYVAPSGEKKNARVVYTSIGASEDLLDENVRRFFTNACLWAGGWEDKITPDLNVAIVGTWHPTPYSMSSLYYRGVRPLDLSDIDGVIMPDKKGIAGLTNPKSRGHVDNVLSQRPDLRATWEAQYPEFFQGETETP